MRELPCTCSFADAGAAARRIITDAFWHRRDVATDDNLRLWAFYCRHFDRALIVDRAFEYASMKRQCLTADGGYLENKIQNVLRPMLSGLQA